MRPLVHDDEEPYASHPLHFPVEATALVFLAAATGTRRIAAYGLPRSPIRGQPQGRILLIFLVFLVFLVFLIFLVFFLEIGESMRHIFPNPAHVPKQEGEERPQRHEDGDQSSLEGRDGKQETQHAPDQQHSGGECEYNQNHKDHEDSNDKKISHTRALLGCSSGGGGRSTIPPAVQAAHHDNPLCHRVASTSTTSTPPCGDGHEGGGPCVSHGVAVCASHVPQTLPTPSTYRSVVRNNDRFIEPFWKRWVAPWRVA